MKSSLGAKGSVWVTAAGYGPSLQGSQTGNLENHIHSGEAWVLACLLSQPASSTLIQPRSSP